MMAFETYVGGTDELAHKVSKVYAGVDGIARGMLKGYVGDPDGIARQIYPGIPPMPARLDLYTAGVSQNENISGGWHGRATTLGRSGEAGTPTGSAFSDFYRATLARVNNSVTRGTWETVKAINLSNFTTLSFTAKKPSGNGSIMFCIISGDNVIAHSSKLNTSKNTMTIDISALSGSYKIAVDLTLSSSITSCSADIYDLYLE